MTSRPPCKYISPLIDPVVSKCVGHTPKLYSTIYIEIRSTENVVCETVGSEMSKEYHEKLYSL